MDALTFGSVRLIRKLTYAEARKEPPLEFELSKVLNELNITMDQFIDLCILCGCDYIPSIRGIGPKTAYKLIKQHKTIEKIVKNIDTKKNPFCIFVFYFYFFYFYFFFPLSQKVRKEA